MTEEGKEKKVNIDFEPFKPINTSLYLCDNKFHTEVRTLPLQEPGSGHNLGVLEPGGQQEHALGWPLDGLALARDGQCLLEGAEGLPSSSQPRVCVTHRQELLSVTGARVVFPQPQKPIDLIPSQALQYCQDNISVASLAIRCVN